ncbi:aminopeptidase, partial [Clostridium saudiense]|nr:aminopeptidase [Clostridium saudiense]
MSINIKDVTFEFVDGLIITAFEDGENNSTELTNIINSTTFKGREGEIFYIAELNEKVKYKIFVGLGKKELLNGEVLRNAMAKAAKKAKELKIEKIG